MSVAKAIPLFVFALVEEGGWNKGLLDQHRNLVYHRTIHPGQPPFALDEVRDLGRTARHADPVESRQAIDFVSQCTAYSSDPFLSARGDRKPRNHPIHRATAQSLLRRSPPFKGLPEMPGAGRIPCSRKTVHSEPRLPTARRAGRRPATKR